MGTMPRGVLPWRTSRPRMLKWRCHRRNWTIYSQGLGLSIFFRPARLFPEGRLDESLEVVHDLLDPHSRRVDLDGVGRPPEGGLRPGGVLHVPLGQVFGDPG